MCRTVHLISPLKLDVNRFCPLYDVGNNADRTVRRRQLCCSGAHGSRSGADQRRGHWREQILTKLEEFAKKVFTADGLFVLPQTAVSRTTHLRIGKQHP